MAAPHLHQLRRLDSTSLRYEPRNEQGVVALFASICEDRYNLRIEDIETGYPDCVAVKRNGQRVRIEFEFESSRFNHEDLNACDWVVCWVDNAKRGEKWRKKLKVIELREQFPELGADVWLQPYRPVNADALPTLGRKSYGWTVPSRARKGDLLLVYRSGRNAAITAIMEVRTTAEYDRKHSWGTGYQAALKKVFDLPVPLSRTVCMTEAQLRDLWFFKRPAPLGRSVLKYWPVIERLMAQQNPHSGLKKALASYAVRPSRVD
jgi:hypothetical protein